MKRRFLYWLLISSLIVMLGAIFAVWHRKPESATPESHKPVVSVKIAENRYVGDRQCATCHASIAESYSRTAMSQSWRRPASTEWIEDYDAAQQVVQAEDGYRYQVHREADRAFQTEYRVDKRGEAAVKQVREVSYVLGSGMKGRAYVTDSNGYLTIMPVAWYSGAEKWDLNPGYHTNNRRFSREVVTSCIMCHNSYPDYVAGSRNRYFAPLPEGIGCERCHGPGERHVREQESAAAIASEQAVEPNIVNPANLSPDLQQDVCLQCHLTTDAGMVFHRGKGAFDFRPGQRLSEFRAQFQTVGQRGQAFSATSHGTRMALSRCFTASNQRLTCIYCHDPHVPVREVPASFFNSRCLTCHQANDCSRTAVVGDEATAHAANDCVACHMPKRPATDIEHTVTADHWIRKQPRDDAKHAGDTDQLAEPVVLEDFFQNANRGELGIAYATHGARAQDARILQQAATLLSDALRQDPGAARWSYWLGHVLLSQGRFAESAQHLERAWTAVATGVGRDSVSEDEQIALYGDMVRVNVRLGRPERAREVMDAFHRAMPQYIPAYESYLEMASATGRPELAIAIAERGIKRNPAISSFWWVLARKELDLDRQRERAVESLKHAIELDPLRTEFHLDLARAYQALGQHDLAEEARRLAEELGAD